MSAEKPAKSAKTTKPAKPQQVSLVKLPNLKDMTDAEIKQWAAKLHAQLVAKMQAKNEATSPDDKK